MQVKRFDSSEGNVWKYVFDFGDAVAEAVLYKYNDFYERTVLCVSIQSGCAVGCTFCGTGRNFIRNLTVEEIVEQVQYCLKDMDIEDIDDWGGNFQIMFMSMGEPLLNISNLIKSLYVLNADYSSAALLVSTVAPKNKDAFEKLCIVSENISKVGLQFSVHEAYDKDRDDLIPFKNKYTVREIRDLGIMWYMRTGRKPYINYCVHQDNATEAHSEKLMDLFPVGIYNLTFSIICEADETMREAANKNQGQIKEFMNIFTSYGYNTRMFDPAGQDDIGGGCGQLWYVQEWMKKHNKDKNLKGLV